MTALPAPDTSGPDLFDYAASRAAKSDGIERVLDNQSMEWKHAYVYHAERFLNALPPRATFIGEDIRKYLLPRIGAPDSPNAWGGASAGVIRRWIKEGRIQACGMAQMTATKSHARQSPLYEVLGEGEVAA